MDSQAHIRKHWPALIAIGAVVAGQAAVFLFASGRLGDRVTGGHPRVRPGQRCVPRHQLRPHAGAARYELSDDPVLATRGGVYAHSYNARLREIGYGQATEAVGKEGEE